MQKCSGIYKEIRLAEYFHECEDGDILMVKESNFQPPQNHNQVFEEIAKNSWKYTNAGH